MTLPCLVACVPPHMPRSLPLDMQQCKSHAINVQSEQVSCSSAVLSQDEVYTPWTDTLVMHTKPIGQGTFGTVYR